ncbi:hypothetical protein C8J57DRAFT_1258421 [Mycena rebaudengoi]|nr:hypothetical protein C8J57DRAFT_1258421 [Mycena rebaudengoi]
MTCVAGDSKYSYYPSPAPLSPLLPRARRLQSLPMLLESLRQLLPVSVPVQAGAVVETLSGRTANGLHTPAALDDFSGKTLGGADEIHKFEAQIRSNAGSTQIGPLRACFPTPNLNASVTPSRDFFFEFGTSREQSARLFGFPRAKSIETVSDTSAARSAAPGNLIRFLSCHHQEFSILSLSLIPTGLYF